MQRLNVNSKENIRDTYDVGISECLTPMLRSEWIRLWENSDEGHFFNSPECFESFLEALHIETYRIVTCRQNDALCAVLPLVRSRMFGTSVWTAAGKEGNYVDKPPFLLMSEDPGLFGALLDAASSLGNICLPEVHERKKELFSGLESSQLLFEPVSVNRFAELSPELEILRFSSSSQKRKMRSGVRSGMQAWKHEFVIFTDDFAAALRTVMDVEARSSKAKRHMAFFGKEINRKIFDAFLKHAPDFLNFAVLYSDGHPIATSAGFVYKGIFTGYHSSFDEAYRRQFPGKLLVFYLLERLKSDGYHAVDFLRGDSDVKRLFADEISMQYDVMISRNCLYLSWWKISFTVRRQIKLAIAVARSVERSILRRFEKNEKR